MRFTEVPVGEQAIILIKCVHFMPPKSEKLRLSAENQIINVTFWNYVTTFPVTIAKYSIDISAGTAIVIKNFVLKMLKGWCTSEISARLIPYLNSISTFRYFDSISSLSIRST